AARPGQRLINLYGASETADQVAAYEVTGVDPVRTPIGTPIANTRIYVLDDAQELVPIGVAGELCAAGVGISTRYLGDSADTRRVFVPDPFVSGERMYRTGDRGRWRHDGILDFLGRASDRIKVRGVRVDPADVEHALLAHADVTAVAVTVQGERLAAHIVCRHGAPLDAPALRRFLRGQLPEPWIPTLMASVPTLPLGPTGKIDRAALPPILEVACASRAPAGDLELAVASEWELILGRRVGAEDDFFAAGGESLTAAQLGARLGERFGLDVPLTTLFERPTVAAQAEWLHAALRTNPTSRVTPLAGDRWVAPSFAQERLWFSHSMTPLAPQPTLRSAIHIEGALDPDRLERAIRQVASRHGALRTVFTTRPVLAQRVVPTCPRAHRDVDLSGLPPTERDVALRATLDEDRDHTFALESGPPWRTTLVKVGPTSYVLLFAVHHLVADGLSVQLWFDELHVFYEQDRPELAPQLINAADLALWQRRTVGSAASSVYWRATLAGATPLDLPLRTPRRGWPDGTAGHVRGQIGLDVLSRLGALASGEQVTMFSVMLAAAYMLLHRVTGATDLVVGTIHGGREVPQARGAFGLFLNPLALRCDLAGDLAANEVVRRAGATARAALAHAELPFERVVADVNPARSPFRHPLFDVVLNHHPPAPELRLGELSVEAVRGVRMSVVPYELMLRTITSSRGLAVQFDFQRDRFDEATVAAWHAEYLVLLHDLARGSA
ncbi:MAG: condensation domain-containing protein, partial [Kofleriaceae bacterium]